jgi:hypothetical protein
MNSVAYYAYQYPLIFTVIGFLVSFGFHWAREWVRLGYAIVEISVGVVTVYKSTPINQGGGFDPTFGKLAVGVFTEFQYLAIFGAIYISPFVA